jgi:asparagine synthase (glutamine-hydrolysing)
MTASPRMSGIYGLFRLDGGPLDASDMQILGLPPGSEPISAVTAGFDQYEPQLVHSHADETGIIVLAGFVSEVEALAARLGLGKDIPIALLALAALARFGAETPAELLGEWSLLHWNSMGQLTVMMSTARRDRLHYAISGQHVAIAPDIMPLGQLPWVGEDIDAAGFLYPLGIAPVREGAGDATMYSAVRQIGPGEMVQFDKHGIRKARCETALPAMPAYTGSFADAVAEAESMLRHIVRERLAHTAKPATMLSGGLDSSLIAWVAASELEAGQHMDFLTSVAPPGSGIPDETAFADMVAQRLGQPRHDIFPGEQANSYCPADDMLGGASGPLTPTRHCLTRAFQAALHAQGATLMLDGTYGEMTATARLARPTIRNRLRRLANAVIYGRQRMSYQATAIESFHVRLAPHLLANLPEPIAALIGKEVSPNLDRNAALLGYMYGAQKAHQIPDQFYAGAVRVHYPYRDVRLLRLFAGFPLKMLREQGGDRDVARHMLKDRLPDAIRLRRSGMPASPDHLVRMQRQALTVRERIPVFRKAEADDWFDLDWLDQALQRVAAQGVRNIHDANVVQITAVMAEFVTWWRLRR